MVGQEPVAIHCTIPHSSPSLTLGTPPTPAPPSPRVPLPLLPLPHLGYPCHSSPSLTLGTPPTPPTPSSWEPLPLLPLPHLGYPSHSSPSLTLHTPPTPPAPSCGGRPTRTSAQTWPARLFGCSLCVAEEHGMLQTGPQTESQTGSHLQLGLEPLPSGGWSE